MSRYLEIQKDPFINEKTKTSEEVNACPTSSNWGKHDLFMKPADKQAGRQAGSRRKFEMAGEILFPKF